MSKFEELKSKIGELAYSIINDDKYIHHPFKNDSVHQWMVEKIEIGQELK